MDKKSSTESDTELFRRAVGKVTPVRNDRVPPVQRRRKPVPRSRQQDDARVMVELLSDSYEPADLETGEELLYHRTGLQHTAFRRLRRGQVAVEAELDLHGMTVAVARQAIGQFLERCTAEGKRCVRIVHGKGKRSVQREPVLKNKVNIWLRQWDRVLAFCSARPVDGGTGAIYVLLKKGKQ